MPGHGRYAYQSIEDRASGDWPGGKRLAVYIALNIEVFAFGEGLGAELAPGGPQPDVLNYTWRDYGNRVGVWRMLDEFYRLELPATVLANSRTYDECPGIMEAFRRRGDEVVAHGRTNAERQGVLDEPAERDLIVEATTRISEEEGRRPEGWLGPWISQSRITPDLLAEAGYRYLLDWCHDDQPVWMATRGGGRILSVPYPQELNDIPAIVARRVEGRQFAEMIVDGFDEQLAQSAKQPLVFGIALHPYIVGQPHRLRPLRRALEHIADHRDDIWLCHAGDIARHWIGSAA
ncbi:polysaccharide deacetylase family protein [Thalassobaculum sp.]|uniref:polysaccharide deacetylase family protein n=1 Tax=Thalassobaculum sp. TaxID=2022740 RepID=UPI0032F02FA7